MMIFYLVSNFGLEIPTDNSNRTMFATAKYNSEKFGGSICGKSENNNAFGLMV